MVPGIFFYILGSWFLLVSLVRKEFSILGIARLHRTGSEHVGPVQRLFEHLVLCRRQHAPHARFLRYNASWPGGCFRRIVVKSP